MPGPTPSKRIIIIGGGPAGLMAADVLSTAGYPVTIYDRMPSVGRKFLLAGRGGLNLTHSEPLKQFLRRYGPAADWMTPYIHAFTPDDLQEFSRTLGEPPFTGSSGRIFPRSFKTSPLLRAWLRRLAGAGVETRLRHEFIGWNERGEPIFGDLSGAQHPVQPAATILAMGGASWPKLGSDGRWTSLLAQKAVDITLLRPANCGFDAQWPDQIIERFAGAPLKSIAAEFNGRRVEGECVITSNGLEGGLVYALSADLRDAIATHGSAELRLDLKPSMRIEALAARLDAAGPKQSISNKLRKAARLMPPAIGMLRLQDLPETSLELARRIKNTPITLTAPRPIERAISTAGGIARDSLNDSLMLKSMPGVFAAGEMLDWEAPTGGYLLQACFSTGVAAAQGVIAWLNQQEPQS